MGTIVIIYEEICVDCRCLIKETAREMKDFYSDSGNGGTSVKRRIILRRCKKCQPIFEEKIKELRKGGKVEVVPFGKSGREEENRQTTLRDFLGRDKNRRKKEMAHGKYR